GARARHTATLVPSGEVLIAGGVRGGYCCIPDTSGAEIYSPTTNSFLPAGAMLFERSGHTAVLLKDGRVLIAGGGGSTAAQVSAELYTTVPVPVPTTTYSLWGNDTAPATKSDPDSRAIEVGVKFKSDIDGVISAIRFYKGPLNTGSHTVSLWSGSGY